MQPDHQTGNQTASASGVLSPCFRGFEPRAAVGQPFSWVAISGQESMEPGRRT